jgi:Cu/Ag efflux pump CusA
VARVQPYRIENHSGLADLAPQLKTVKGVTEINSFGVLSTIDIVVNPGHLRTFQIISTM